MSKIFFISDLHLCEAETGITQIFMRFLQSQALEAEVLYILGDLFETWVGDDDRSAYHLSIMHALRAASDAGLIIYFMHGNRDFLIGKQFAHQTGVRLLADPTVISLNGVKTLLMHGDSLCTQDKQHQLTRRFTLNPICQWLALRLPLAWRKRGAAWMRGKSRQHHQDLTDWMMDVEPSAVAQVMRAHQTTRLIHGHTHRPGVHQLAEGERMVLGAWHETGSVLVCESHRCELTTIS